MPKQHNSASSLYLNNLEKMKYTETEADKILDKLIASTHSPRGRYSEIGRAHV